MKELIPTGILILNETANSIIHTSKSIICTYKFFPQFRILATVGSLDFLFFKVLKSQMHLSKFCRLAI